MTPVMDSIALSNPPLPDTSPLMDGFLYLPALRFLPYRYYPLALGGLETLRRAALYRPRWFVVPDDINEPIAAYDTLEYQVSVAAGAYLWGYQFTQLAVEGETFTVNNAGGLLVQVTDACSGIPLFSDFVVTFGLSVTSSGTSLGAPLPILLPQPRLILDPGLVNVEVSNRLSTDAYSQLLLLFAEPCVMTGERRQI